jgi:hypothetical protein
MEVTVKAILKLKEDSTQETQIKPTPVIAQQRPVTGKKFTKEPTLMKDFLKSQELAKQSKNLPEKRVKLSETNEKKAESSPDKETKNARKKRERKELAKKESANKRKNESLSDS